MQSLFTEREQIVETVNKLFVYTDNQEWNKLQDEVFESSIEIDMVSMGADRPERITSREICHRWGRAFEELDAVHHQAGNYIVNMDGDAAVVMAYSVATHFKESAKKGKTREYVGSYELKLKKSNIGWRIQKFKYLLKYSTGNITLE